MSIQRKHLMLLFLVVFGVFYVTVFNDICVVDDRTNLMDFSFAGGASLKELFFPRAAAGGYYRPLVGLSYLVDLRLWDLDSRTLHMENVLLHCLNALMVYQLALALLPRERRERNLIALVCGLGFGLHPITTESVNWISGRTDLFAGFFVLLAAVLLIRYQRSGAWPLLVGGILSVLAGMLGKEVALGFIPGAFFLSLGVRCKQRPSEGEILSSQEALWLLVLAVASLAAELYLFNFWVVLAAAPIYGVLVFLGRRSRHSGLSSLSQTLWPLLFGVAAVAVGVGIGFAVRRLAFTSDIARFPQTVKLMLQDPNHTISVFLGGAGFYVKKFLFPLPLNFGIREIAPFYALLGTVLVLAFVHFAVRRTLVGSLVLTGAFLFVPALPLAFGTVAWTAYAERYVYISSAFWIVALVLWLAPHVQRCGPAAGIAVGIVLVAAGVVTVQRNLVWQDSLVLMRDTVQKSPRFRDARGMYMTELLRVGDLRGAEEQYRIACTLSSSRYDERLDEDMAKVYLKQGKEREALALYRQVYKKTRGACSKTVRMQLQNLVRREIEKAQPEERIQLQNELLLYQQPSRRKGPNETS